MAGALVDTDVLIDGLRGDVGVLERIQSAAGAGLRHISVLTAAELRAGESGDDPAVDQLIADFRVLPLDLATAEHGGRLRRGYAASHGTDLVDAVLAAIALENDFTLVTNNSRHFPMPGLKLG
jgi:tRNA(fMet)-specific endonuclease VapC